MFIDADAVDKARKEWLETTGFDDETVELDEAGLPAVPDPEEDDDV